VVAGVVVVGCNGVITKCTDCGVADDDDEEGIEIQS
jgi:hypothetical protein